MSDGDEFGEVAGPYFFDLFLHSPPLLKALFLQLIPDRVHLFAYIRDIQISLSLSHSFSILLIFSSATEMGDFFYSLLDFPQSFCCY
jgi:hypothetical protein